MNIKATSQTCLKSRSGRYKSQNLRNIHSGSKNQFRKEKLPDLVPQNHQLIIQPISWSRRFSSSVSFPVGFSFSGTI